MSYKHGGKRGMKEKWRETEREEKTTKYLLWDTRGNDQLIHSYNYFIPLA